jgi:ferritin
MKFFDFIQERDGKVTLTQVEAPKTTWESPLEAFQDAYQHECKISGLINGLVDLSLKESDHAANAFLQWFVTEQVEEEAAALTIVDKLKLVGDSNVALFMLDGELGQRTFTPPAAAPAG